MSGARGAERVIIHGAPALDEHGDPVAGATPSSQTIDGCVVYPSGTSTESEFLASTVVDGVMAILPDEYDIDPSSTLEWRGRTYEIVGEPGLWTFSDGLTAGTQVRGKRVRG